MGLPEFNPLHIVYAPHLGGLAEVKPSSSAFTQQVLQLDELLHSIHQRVDKATAARRLANRKQQAKRVVKRSPKDTSPIVPDPQDLSIRVDFQVGDFVMVALPERHRHKLEATWRGPYKVLRCVNASTYEVVHLLTHARRVCHVRRLKFYCDSHAGAVIFP